MTQAVGAAGAMIPAMHHIRPWRLFTALESPIYERIAQVSIPPRRAFGGITLLETFLLLTCSKIVEARRIFEFGTFLGSTTLSLALNTPDDAEIFTLDLDHSAAKKAIQDANDVQFTETHLAANAHFDFTETSVNRKITTLVGNSKNFDFSAWNKSIDMTFIDGGHDVPTAASDTENAFSIAARSKPSCILWHDYRAPEYPELTGYLDDLSRKVELFHLEDTKLCVHFTNGVPDPLLQLN